MRLQNRPKLTRPRSQDLTRRNRVLRAIDHALRGGACWISAPAGYGKTTGAVDYLDTRQVSHLWYRVDESDVDIASFFHHLGLATPGRGPKNVLPVFGAEYADDPEAFAQRFFGAWFARLDGDALLVFDDVHRADQSAFRSILALLLQALPAGVHCVCLSRKAPGREFAGLRAQHKLAVIGQATLRFSEREARALVAHRLKRAAALIDVGAARGWAAGLVVLAERAASGDVAATDLRSRGPQAENAVFTLLANQFIDSLPPAHREVLLSLSLLPEIRPELAVALVGAEHARQLIQTLQRRQFLLTRSEGAEAVFHFHDLLRDVLRERFEREHSPTQLASLRERAACLLRAAGHIEPAVNLALQAGAWTLAHELIAGHAEALLAQGRRATLIEWAAALPAEVHDAWLCYWLGVANMADDAAAERWLIRAWERFSAQQDARGQSLTAARAVLAKTDSWRTHEGLAQWTERVAALLERELPVLHPEEQLLVWTGTLRGVDFAADYRTDAPAVQALTRALLARLEKPLPQDSSTLRLMASASLIEHAGSCGHREIFERAVDSVCDDLRDRSALPWAFGTWLIGFGAVSGRYFPYKRRNFPYDSSEAALRAAVALGEREALRGVEFGALYHLQLQMKSRNDFSEFGRLIARLAEIADSRYTTQVAVVADCEAALHTIKGDFAPAHRACERFMAAIEAANEPPIERWPHFITRFQVLLAEGRPDAAARFLADRLHLFDGGVRLRTESCIAIARTLEAERAHDPQYEALLRSCMDLLSAANWPAVLLNMPETLASLCAQALERSLATEFCCELIRRRRLTPPPSRPSAWPWALRIYVLGEFRIALDGALLELGPKPPTRSLHLLRLLAISRDHTAALAHIYDRIWPDADGDSAKAACEQALHRLRKLLGRADLFIQREGRLTLASELVWVDVAAWERAAMSTRAASELTSELRLFESFSGPLLADTEADWAAAAAERVRGKYVDLAVRLGRRLENTDRRAALNVYQRALEFYPTSERLYEALLRTRLADGDASAALDDYRRYARLLRVQLNSRPSSTITSLIKNYIDPSALD